MILATWPQAGDMNTFLPILDCAAVFKVLCVLAHWCVQACVVDTHTWRGACSMSLCVSVCPRGVQAGSCHSDWTKHGQPFSYQDGTTASGQDFGAAQEEEWGKGYRKYVLEAAVSSITDEFTLLCSI